MVIQYCRVFDGVNIIIWFNIPSNIEKQKNILIN